MAGLLELVVLVTVLATTLVLSTAQTQLEIQEDTNAGSLSIARFLIFIAGAVVLILATPNRVWAIVIAIGLPIVWLLQQLLGRYLGRLAIGIDLAEIS